MIQEKLSQLAKIETLVLLAVLLSIPFAQYSSNQLEVVWEVIPALFAAVITSFGLLKMKEIS